MKIPAKPPSKQLKSEEVDTFRGVHLDPNAHHWDEVCLLIDFDKTPSDLLSVL